ncbi:unnamed protein product, partial [Closterium sp. Naga37s-1]
KCSNFVATPYFPSLCTLLPLPSYPFPPNSPLLNAELRSEQGWWRESVACRPAEWWSAHVVAMLEEN